MRKQTLISVVFVTMVLALISCGPGVDESCWAHLVTGDEDIFFPHCAGISQGTSGNYSIQFSDLGDYQLVMNFGPTLKSVMTEDDGAEITFYSFIYDFISSHGETTTINMDPVPGVGGMAHGTFSANMDGQAATGEYNARRNE